MEAPPCLFEQEVQVTEPTAKETLTVLVEAANRGDQGSVEALRQWLDDHPETWREAGDLAAHVEKTWLRLAAGGNVLVEESIRREADRVRGELLSTSPSRLRGSWSTKSSLVGSISSRQRSVRHLLVRAAPRRDAITISGSERAQRRYFAAIKMLAKVRVFRSLR